MHPIWLRKAVALGSADEYEFYIQADGTEIYRGRAYKRPGASSTVVVLNDIVRDYLSPLPASGSIIPDDDEPIAVDVPLAVEFKTYVVGTPDVLKDTTAVLLDWSYDTYRATALNVATPKMDLGAPIIPEHNDALPYIYTVPNARTLTYDPDDPQTISTTGAGVLSFGPAWLAGSSFSFYDSVKDATVTVPLRKYCGTWYALVYLNAYGGWDQLTCEGRSLQTRSYTRRTVAVAADNSQTGIDIARRAVVNYGTDEAQRWQLSTPFLTDQQSAQMHHLLGSREVWLTSSANPSRFVPVLIASDSVEVKTFDNQEGGMIAYSFEVTLAEERQR